MALIVQIAALWAIVGAASARGLYNRYHRPQHDFKDFQQILADMFQPPGSMQGLLQIKPANHPGILGFGTFGQGVGDYNDPMAGSNQGGYGQDDYIPNASRERDGGFSPGPVYNFGDQRIDSEGDPKNSGDMPGYADREADEGKPCDDGSCMNKEVDDAAEKDESDKKSDESPKTNSAPHSHKNKPEDDSISKKRNKDAIVFPDNDKQTRDKIAKESNYYVNPSQANVPQIIYAVSVTPSTPTASQASYIPNTVPSNGQTQPTATTGQNYPPTNMNVHNTQPQYQTNANVPISNVDNPPKIPGYTLVTIPNGSNGVNNSPVYYTINAPPSNQPTNVNYQPVSAPQQYYIVSMNGQNVLVPVSNVQTSPNQLNDNKQFNLVPINQGTYLPSNGQLNYGSPNNQNTASPQNNGQVQYIAVQLSPQSNPPNQVSFVSVNQGTAQTPGQNTAQRQVSYVPTNTQTVVPMSPQNNPAPSQVPYLPSTPSQGVPTTQQNNPQAGNQVYYVPANSQTVMQVAPSGSTNSGQVTYVPLNGQNPSGTNQYQLVPITPQNAHLLTSGTVPLVVFKEKAELTPKSKKHVKRDHVKVDV